MPSHFSTFKTGVYDTPNGPANSLFKRANRAVGGKKEAGRRFISNCRA
jgi:hypothetical protein